jgi:hypothetical protein
MGCIGSRDDAADNTQARKRNEEPSPLERIDLSQRPSKSALRRSNTFSIIRKRVSILEGEQARRASFSAAIGPSSATASGGSASASSAAARLTSPRRRSCSQTLTARSANKSNSSARLPLRSSPAATTMTAKGSPSVCARLKMQAAEEGRSRMDRLTPSPSQRRRSRQTLSRRRKLRRADASRLSSLPPARSLYTIVISLPSAHNHTILRSIPCLRTAAFRTRTFALCIVHAHSVVEAPQRAHHVQGGRSQTPCAENCKPGDAFSHLAKARTDHTPSPSLSAAACR